MGTGLQGQVPQGLWYPQGLAQNWRERLCPRRAAHLWESLLTSG